MRKLADISMFESLGGCSRQPINEMAVFNGFRTLSGEAQTYLDTLCNDIIDAVIEELPPGHYETLDDIEEYCDFWDIVHDRIDQTAMYYKEAHDIVGAFQCWSWDDYNKEFGPIDSIGALAHCVLEEAFSDDGVDRVITGVNKIFANSGVPKQQTQASTGGQQAAS